MTAYPIKERYGDTSCTIVASNNGNGFIGIVRYRTYENGTLFGKSAASITEQFRAICAMIDEGAMLRHGIIMTGYHNDEVTGHVLLADGEIIGKWSMDEVDSCHFFANDSKDIACSAPSPWLLHDSIANWLKSGETT